VQAHKSNATVVGSLADPPDRDEIASIKAGTATKTARAHEPTKMIAVADTSIATSGDSRYSAGSGQVYGSPKEDIGQPCTAKLVNLDLGEALFSHGIVRDAGPTIAVGLNVLG
jgi:hypothetical protein